MNEITTVGVDLAKEVTGYLDERKALLSRTRGLLAEFGVWIGRLTAALTRQLPRLAQDEQLPGLFRPIHAHSLEHLRRIDERIAECDVRVQAILGLGPLTASALIATITNPQDFRNGRQMSAWGGLVPRQNSSGGKTRLGAITKRGDTYLRGLLTQGARSTLQVALKREVLRRSRQRHFVLDGGLRRDLLGHTPS